MNNLIFDTDIFIDYLRGFAKAKSFLEKARKDSLLYFSAITEAELISAQECNRIDRKEHLLIFLSTFNKVLVSNEIAVKAGDFKRVYALPLPDALIAATAFVTKASLVTRNIKDYQKIKEITLKVPY
ncbi:type II toxin-antitoxin system VapC family toxin [Candidatus Woesearchaeota archaeon]|nr:type II toxin-antitoxin system VapC family toxin [Candidatus Woesearchaeota archaeon]